jgi:hypothetical protein
MYNECKAQIKPRVKYWYFFLLVVKMVEFNVATALAKALALYIPWQEVARSCIQCEQRNIGLAMRHT